MAKHGRGFEAPEIDSLPLSLPDVYLLTSDSSGEVVVEGLALVVDDDGVTVVSPSGATAAALAWTDLTVLKTDGRVTTPRGEDAVVIEASTASRRHRFAVPTADAAELENTVAAITGVPAPRPPRRRRRRLRD